MPAQALIRNKSLADVAKAITAANADTLLEVVDAGGLPLVCCKAHPPEAKTDEEVYGHRDRANAALHALVDADSKVTMQKVDAAAAAEAAKKKK